MDRTFPIVFYCIIGACLLDVIVGGWFACVCGVSSQCLTAKRADGALLMLAITLLDNVVVGVVVNVLRGFATSNDTFSHGY